MKTLLFFSILLPLVLFSSEKRLLELPHLFEETKRVETVYGNVTVEEPVFWELVQSPVMQRLKHVHQYGIANYLDQGVKAYSRFDHSVGVFVLLRLYGATLSEQIAGLLHDASHTIFSHTGDYLFQKMADVDAYQDDIHEWYLKAQGVEEIVSKYGLLLSDILPKSGVHTMLEQELPDLCVDRIEYNIQEGLMNGLLSTYDLPYLLQSLKFKEGVWYFNDLDMAKKFSRISLYGTEYIWGGPYIYVQNTYTARLLQKAIDDNVITFDDIHFSIDQKVLDTLYAEPAYKELFSLLHGYRESFSSCYDKNHHFVVKTKMRGVNPWVETSEGLKRLTELDDAYAREYLTVLDRSKRGWPIYFESEEYKELFCQDKSLCN